MHETTGNVLQALVDTNPPPNMAQARDIINDALATAINAILTTALGSLDFA